jgi:hypothetical protein
MTYDNWKTTNPADEFLGPEPEEEEEMDMVERVARAISDNMGSDDEGALYWGYDKGYADRYHEIARAVIARMREPTQEMLNAVYDLQAYDPAPVTVWQIMNDAALNEKSPGQM